MKKQLILYLLALVVTVIGVSFWAYQNSKPLPSDGKLILYYRDGCPHCINVEKYISENKVLEQLPQLQIKEGAINRENTDEMLQYAKKCRIPLNQVGFPFLWNGETCLLGDVDIINYFSEQIKNK